MKLVLLGTGGYFPTCERHTACMMLPEPGIVLDAGTGICRIGEYLQTDRLDIYLTHAHLDHVAGLTYLVNLLPPEVQRRTIVHGEAAKLDAVRDHLFAVDIFPVEPTFQFAPLAGPVALESGATLRYFTLRHPGGAIGYRLDWPGHSLAYVTDTTASLDADYIEQLRGVDLLVHEANFPTEVDNLPAITGHSALQSVAEVAAAAGVGRLVLVHADPQVDARRYDLNSARRTFADLTLGEDGMELEF
jgi:ribonuclease BN (tRNA processing enzyme)